MEPRHANSPSSARKLSARASSSTSTSPAGLCGPAPTPTRGSETSNMQPNEPSRTALMIARQRAAHQVLDRGSILDDPFAIKILRKDEDETTVLQFANAHPLASI